MLLLRMEKSVNRIQDNIGFADFGDYAQTKGRIATKNR